MKFSKFRDITLIDLNENQVLAIACDSAGGIGNKEKDIIKTSPEILGYFTTMVALSEIISIGAEPITVVNTLSVEMDVTGKRVLFGINKAINQLKKSDEVVITGSTEENFSVVQTGIGITVIGIINKNEWQQPKTKKGSLAVVVGLPKVGNEVLLDNGEQIISIPLIAELFNSSYIQEILPVGSKGILYEAEEMAKTNNLSLDLDEEILIDMYKSGGPATCAVISLDEENYISLKQSLQIPVNRVGRFK